MSAPRLEVHEHTFITGPRAKWIAKVVHSHEGGDQPHTHPDTGPACYTIDKDEWFARTGLRGGGRKKFTSKPSGEQFATATPDDSTFEIIVDKPPADFNGEGGGIYTAVRMQLAFGMTVSAVKAARS